MTNSHVPHQELSLVGNAIKRRRHWGVLEKLQLVKKIMEPGMTVSEVARKANIAASQLFKWKHLYETGQLTEKKTLSPGFTAAQDGVDLVAKLTEAHLYILELEQALGRKTLENEMLKRIVPVKSLARRRTD